MSRLVAIADAHLGRAHYQAVDPNGLNQREVDFAASWHRAVEAALGLDPDAVLVLGDLFDAPRPTYRAFREGAKGLRNLAGAGVPVFAGAFTPTRFEPVERQEFGGTLVTTYRRA